MSQSGTKKRVVFTTWGSFGDLHPFMALALELQERGYTSVIATSPLYREKVEAAGIAFHPVRPDLPSPDAETSAEISVAVANEMVIAHPQGHDGHASTALSLLLFGGPVLFLAAQGWYLWAVLQASPRLHLAGSAALVLEGFAAWVLPPYVVLILACVSLTILAILDQRSTPATMAAESEPETT